MFGTLVLVTWLVPDARAVLAQLGNIMVRLQRNIIFLWTVAHPFSIMTHFHIHFYYLTILFGFGD